MSDDVQALVLNFGSSSVQAGFAGDDAPRAVFPSVIGRPKHQQMMVGVGNKDSYVGDEAQAHRGMMKTTYPIKNGIVHNWDDWEKLVHHTCYNELRVAPEEHPALLPVPVMNPIANEQKACQIMFETFSVPACAGAFAPALSLYASGRGVGIVIEIGEGVTQIVPIWQSAVIDDAIIRTDVAGGAMTDYLARMVTERSRGRTTPTSADLFCNLDKMKRDCCYTAADYDAELAEFATSSSRDISFSFEDGTNIVLNNERIRCGELLFKPKLMGYETAGLHKLIQKSLLKCPIDLRRDFHGNFILSGGTSMMPGFSERLSAELTNVLPQSSRVKVVAPPERKYSTWIGGSILASLSTFQHMWMSKEDYDEQGPMGYFKYGCLRTTLHPLPHWK